MRNRTLVLGIILSVTGITLAGIDYVLKERPHELAMQQQTDSGALLATDIPVIASSASSSSMFVKKGTSTKKKGSVDIPTLLTSLQFIPTETSEVSLLQRTAITIQPNTKVLLMNNDRAALFAWIENDDVKTLFSAMKKALQEQFSPKLTNLVDETLTQENGPPVDVLSFIDPAISSEKIVFIRVRNRLYELHIVTKNEEAVQRLMEELKK